MENILIAVVVAILIAFMQRLSRRPAALSQDGTSVILKPSWVGIAMGGIALAIGIGAGCLPLLVETKASERPLIVGVGALFGGLGAILVNDARGRVQLMSDRIEAFSPWRGKRTLKWSEVISVGYSPINRWFILKGAATGTIRVSAMYVGVSTFVERLRANVAASVCAKALDIYEAQSKQPI